MKDIHTSTSQPIVHNRQHFADTVQHHLKTKQIADTCLYCSYRHLEISDICQSQTTVSHITMTNPRYSCVVTGYPRGLLNLGPHAQWHSALLDSIRWDKNDYRTKQVFFTKNYFFG